MGVRSLSLPVEARTTLQIHVVSLSRLVRARVNLTRCVRFINVVGISLMRKLANLLRALAVFALVILFFIAILVLCFRLLALRSVLLLIGLIVILAIYRLFSDVRSHVHLLRCSPSVSMILRVSSLSRLVMVSLLLISVGMGLGSLESVLGLRAVFEFVANSSVLELSARNRM